MKMYHKVIALGADIHYLDKVETVIKSVSVHNHEVKFVKTVLLYSQKSLLIAISLPYIDY